MRLGHSIKNHLSLKPRRGRYSSLLQSSPAKTSSPSAPSNAIINWGLILGPQALKTQNNVPAGSKAKGPAFGKVTGPPLLRRVSCRVNISFHKENHKPSCYANRWLLSELKAQWIPLIPTVGGHARYFLGLRHKPGASLATSILLPMS